MRGISFGSANLAHQGHCHWTQTLTNFLNAYTPESLRVFSNFVFGNIVFGIANRCPDTQGPILSESVCMSVSRQLSTLEEEPPEILPCSQSILANGFGQPERKPLWR